MKSLIDIQPYKTMFVDAMNLCARSYHGMLGLEHNGKSTAMLYGVARHILDWRKRNPGIRFVFIWEGRDSWRKSKYPIYKANRKHTTNSDDHDVYLDSVRQVKDSLISMGVDQVVADTYEADDLVWTVMHDYSQPHIFVTTDWDWWPLVAYGDILYKNDVLSVADLKLRFSKKYKCESINMNRLWLFKALTGDPSDGISGIPRFPKKIAAELCNDSSVTSDNLVDKIIALGKIPLAERTRTSMWLFERNVDLVSPRLSIAYDKVPGVLDMDSFESILLHNGMQDLHERLVKGW